MTRYTVVFEGIRYGALEVEASSEQEARDLAEDRLTFLELSDWYDQDEPRVISIEERPGE